MEALRAYLNSLPPGQQAEFAARCGTTVGYLRKALSKGSALGEGLCINIERESAQRVTCEALRPDGVDWAYIRNSRPPLVLTGESMGQGAAPPATEGAAHA